MSLARPKFQSYESLAEAQFYDDKSLPSMGATTVRFAPLLLEVPLFGIARNVDGVKVDATWTKAGRGSVRYRGPALSQSHQTLLFTLVHVRAGQPVGNIVEFYPHELLALMGWSTNSRNTGRLHQMLEELFESRIDIWGANEVEKDALSVRFFADKKTPTAHGVKWSVSMSETVLGLFRGELSNINVRKRTMLREGLATFLYGYLCASNGNVAFKFADIHSACGSQTRLSAFVAKLEEALVSRNPLIADTSTSSDKPPTGGFSTSAPSPFSDERGDTVPSNAL